ncbi:hypothetical protein GCM10010415_05260 [Streptomyces atrovirens]
MSVHHNMARTTDIPRQEQLPEKRGDLPVETAGDSPRGAGLYRHAAPPRGREPPTGRGPEHSTEGPYPKRYGPSVNG